MNRLAPIIALLLVCGFAVQVHALTETELRQQIEDLLRRVSALQTELDRTDGVTSTASTASGTNPTGQISSGAVTSGGLSLARYLERGMRGEDVAQLQRFLAKDSSMYPSGEVTSFFGPLTEQAVQRFQVACGIVSAGDYQSTGYGRVGPHTRYALQHGCGTAHSGGSVPAQVGGFLRVTPVVGQSPLIVSAEATVNTTRGCEAAAYTLDFGDGSTPRVVSVPQGRCAEVVQLLSHTYTTAGSYVVSLGIGTHRTTVRVSVTPSGSTSGTIPATTFEGCAAASGSVIMETSPRQCRTNTGHTFTEVRVTPTAPATTVSVGVQVPVSVPVTFNTIPCNNTGRNEQTVRINWGDGTYSDLYTHSFGLGNGECGREAVSRTVSHAYAQAGTYSVVVEDLRPTTSATMGIVNASTVRVVHVGTTSTVGTVQTANRLSLSPNTGAAPLSVLAQVSARVGDPYEIDWGDGTAPSASGSFADRASLPGNTVFPQADQNIALQHTYTTGGTKNLVLKHAGYELENGQYVWRTRFYTRQVFVTGGTTSTGTPTTDALSAAPTSGAAPLSTTFTVTINGAKSCASGEYTLDFGDGEKAALPFASGLCNTQGYVVTHRYANAGTYTAKLYAVPQAQVGSATAVQSATITATGGNTSTSVPFTVTIGVGSNTRAVEAKFTLTNSCTTYLFEWGDGQTSTGGTSTGSCASASTAVSLPHTYSAAGTYTMKLKTTVSGATSEQQASVSISS